MNYWNSWCPIPERSTAGMNCFIPYGERNILVMPVLWTYISDVSGRNSKRIPVIRGMSGRNGERAIILNLSIFRIFRSLRFRIFAIVAITGVLACLSIHYAIISSYERRAVSLRTSEVQTQMMILANHLINYNYLADQSSEVVGAELNMLANLYDGRVMVIDRNLKIRRDTYDISQGKVIISEEVIKCLKNGASGATSKYDKQNGYIETTTPIISTRSLITGGTSVDYSSLGRRLNAADDSQDAEEEQEIIQGVLLTSVSTEYIKTTMSILTRNAAIIEIIVISLIIVFAFWVSNALLKPFQIITRSINDVKAGFADEPITGPNYIETESIIHAFNKLLERMKVLDDSRQEFVSNVSHELRTPITSMKVLADSLLAQDEVPAEVYRDFMEDIAAEVDREDKIISDLLSMVRMDKRATELNVASVDIVEMTEIILKRLRPIARRRGIELTLESAREVVAEVDEVKLSLAIMNLIENAVKYNRDNGFVHVMIDADHQFFTVRVSDSGIGIPEESLAHIYERFYRVDKSRSREIGGTGLGLSIAKSAILMHRGELEVESTSEEGTTFVIKVPLKYTNQG